MANPVIINPTMTLAGQAAAINASNTGLELVIDGITFGRGHYDPTGDEVALVDPVGSRVVLAGGSRPTPFQLRMSAAWKENVGVVAIGEIGFWAGDVLVFVWSKDNGDIASYKTDGVTYVLFCDLAFTQVPADSVTIVVDPGESAALAALSEHEGSKSAHPGYLLRSDVAQESGQLAWLGLAGGTANALVLSLVAVESELTSLEPGQRFQFRAALTNTDAVTANIEGIGDVPVMRGGDAGLVALDPGDIKADSLYDLNYDGTHFQLGGGVGSGKSFERFSFTAAVAQSEFTFAHTPGSLIALRNGREFYDFTSAPNGSKVTTVPMNLNDRVEFLAFKSFKVANTYTKAELNALLATAGSLPVGTMLPFPMGVVPTGYLEVDNSLFKDDLYPDLAAYLAKKFNLAGDAAGYTRLPESRGEFFRGWDHGRGIDVGRTLGSGQLSQNLRHGHPWPLSIQSDAVATEFDPATWTPNSGLPKVMYADPSPGDNGSALPTAWAESGGAEARPRNLAVMWCIKAWSAPINQGNIDVAALAAQVANLATDMNQGFAISLGANSYIKFPTRLGGLLIQWGELANMGGNTVLALTLPLTYQVSYKNFTAYSNDSSPATLGEAPGSVRTSMSVLTVGNGCNATETVAWLTIGV